MTKSERRSHDRKALDVDVNVHSTHLGVVPGRGIDISATGMAAILPIELDIEETVNLEFRIGVEAINVQAVVKSKNVFRHGFQFVKALPTCKTV